jgi:N-acetylmuramoyl-L-alanine amidase
MGSTYLTWMADKFRQAGLNVVEYKDWKTRARSSGGYEPGRPLCVMWHHTASSTSADNDAYYMCFTSPDRPICNVMIARDGSVWCLGAGATNTNGKGNSMSFSRGSVPQDKMNEYAVGVEMCNAGTGEPYPQVQIDAMFTVSNVLNLNNGNLPSDVCTHRHYAPDRKIDPATAAGVQGPWKPKSCTSAGTWDVVDIRDECQRRAEAPPPQEDEDVAPASLYLGGGRLDNFVTGDDGALYHNWYQPGSGWMPWVNLGGHLVGSPSVSGQGNAAGDPVRIDVCGKGTDGALWHIFYPGETAGKWSEWERVAEWP